MENIEKNNLTLEEYKYQIYKILIEMNWDPYEAESLIQLLHEEISDGWIHNFSCEVMA